MIEIWTSDFETNNYESDCRVWSWGSYNIYTGEYVHGLDIRSWCHWAFAKKRVIYFHNLKFDGSFIVDYILKTGFKLTNERKLGQNEFRAMISEQGQWYKLELKGRKNRVIIKDSYKVLSSSLAQIANSMHFEVQKGCIDYERFRPVGYQPTPEEQRYQWEDVYIAANALKPLLEKGMTKLTAGSNALHYYKTTKFGDESGFRAKFPELCKEDDEWIRNSYRGGVTMVKSGEECKDHGNGVVYDINSMYPWAMHSPNKYPIGEPIWGYGPPPDDMLYIVKVWVLAKLKRGKPPTIQLKKSRFDVGIEYAQELPGAELVLTSIDLDLLKRMYEIEDIMYYEWCAFESEAGLFDAYIDEFYELKATAKKEMNFSEVIRSKLYLNSLYGKFATRILGRSKFPELGEDGKVHYEAGDLEDRDGVYLPVGVFVTAYARKKLLTSIESVYDRFLYCDTDSIHLKGWGRPNGIEVDSYKLGAWKEEMKFDKAKYLRAKLYMERDAESGEVTVVGAGMGHGVKEQVTFDNFEFGALFNGNLKAKIVPGGTVLLRGEFKIRK